MVATGGPELVGKEKGLVRFISGSGLTLGCEDGSSGTVVLLVGSSGFSIVSVGEATDGASRASLKELSPFRDLWYLVAGLVQEMVWTS